MSHSARPGRYGLADARHPNFGSQWSGVDSTAMRLRPAYALFVFLCIANRPGIPAPQPNPDATATIQVLSSRPELVTAGDALVQISLPSGVDGAIARVAIEGRDVTQAFNRGEKGTLVGLVENLAIGRNRIRVVAGSASAQIEIVNHQVTGPVLSGPHLTPFACKTQESGLGLPLDANCSAATKIEYFYKSTAGEFKSLPEPLTARPADLATVTTRDARTLPYIVRVESGTINRGIYRIGILDDPATRHGRWAPGPGWNRRIVVSFGGGVGTKYHQGVNAADWVLVDDALSRGFAVMTSTQNGHALHANDALSGEALMMVKEHFIERYGIPAWTVGRGASSGAMQQLLIAQNFPGLLDGLLLNLAYPDHISVWADTTDCRLLRRYFSDRPEWTKEQQQAVEGSTFGTCTAWDPFFDAIVASNVRGCDIPAEFVYDRIRNPKGARCTIWDTNANTYGRNPVTGAAGRTLDNVGVEYGRRALLDRIITPAQFVDLNRHVGGYDGDGNTRVDRTVADSEAVRLAYAAGRVNGGYGSLGSIPIIQYRQYLDGSGNIHDHARDFAVRERLVRTNGRADNQVIWVAAEGKVAPVATLAFDTIAEWLDARVRDESSDSAAVKTARAKPRRAIDACWAGDGTRIDEPFVHDATGRCNSLYPPHGNSRTAAGAPMAGDILKCQLKSLAATNYPGIAFSVEEWQQLRSIFPKGVCDYAAPGHHQGPPAGTYLSLPLQRKPVSQ